MIGENMEQELKKYKVVLTKSYIVTIQAENEEKARFLTEYFTSDISDLSIEKDRENHNFCFEDIDCKTNETYEVNEIS
jgi:hypothetical protein